jgi:homoserine kinase type II
MAVYTTVSPQAAQTLLDDLALGTLSRLQGIQGGIENTNYFVDSDRGSFVLTLFERLSHAQLPFYLELMRHLAQKGIAVPAPHANASGAILHTVAGKPAALVDKLAGSSQLAPQAVHCAAMGQALAQLHVAGADFALQQPNLRGLPWIAQTLPVVLPYVNAEQAELLRSELAAQQALAAGAAYGSLPRGAIHADLFRDNAMFVGEQISGIFDFYFAGTDAWIFDLAVCLNDWCIHLPSGQDDALRVAAFVQAYETVRPLTAAERELLPAMRRLGALRFWVSRLWDFHLPREASALQAHDPKHFERVLLALRAPQALEV